MKWLIACTSVALAIGAFALDGVPAVAVALAAVMAAAWYEQQRR